MNSKLLLKGAGLGLALSVGIFISDYMKDGPKLSSTTYLILFFTCMLVGYLSAFIDKKVRFAGKCGPNSTELKWYSSPVLWFGVPMLILCFYIVIN